MSVDNKDFHVLWLGTANYISLKHKVTNDMRTQRTCIWCRSAFVVVELGELVRETYTGEMLVWLQSAWNRNLHQEVTFHVFGKKETGMT